MYIISFEPASNARLDSMNKKLKIALKVLVPVMALGALINSVVNTYIIHDSEIFSQDMSEHDTVAASFRNQIESATHREDSDEADRVRIDSEMFEETWRRSRSILETVTALLFGPPTDIDLDTKASVGMWLVDVETHPEWGLTFDTAELGHAWFVAGDYERAANVYQTALDKSVDDVELQLSRVRALFYASISAENEDLRIQFDEQAYAVFQGTFTQDYEDRLPGFIASDPEFVDYMATLAREINPNQD